MTECASQQCITQRHVASRHVKPCHIVSCHVAYRDMSFPYRVQSWHQSAAPVRTSVAPKIVCGVYWNPPKNAGSQWAKFGPKTARNLSPQDPLRCTDAITRGRPLYVIQRIWSCINQNLNLPPHVAWVTFRGQKPFGLVFQLIFDVRQCARARLYFPTSNQ